MQEAAIQNRLAELRNAIANLQREERQLGDQVAKLTGVQQALEKKDQELGLPASDEDGGTTAIEARLASVTTFVGVDLEQEKKRILESYGIQPAAAKK